MRPKINNHSMKDADYIRFLELSLHQQSEELQKYQVENLKLKFLLDTEDKNRLKNEIQIYY